MKVEYIITYTINGSFLETVENFNSLLMTNSDISIDKNILKYQDLSFTYNLVNFDIVDKNQRLYKLHLEYLNDDEIDLFLFLLKSIREIVYKTEGKVTIVWDDISNFYAYKSYPEINKIENQLRKLITYFMISKLGDQWSDESTPSEVKSNIRNKRDNSNYLHDTDFIQLADYLFKPYSNKNVELLFRDLKKRKNLDNIDINHFNDFIPKSNWERYFSQFVPCEDGQLLKNWGRLY